MNNIKYQCAVCGTKYACETSKCIMCGWKHDVRQELDHDLQEGLNKISFNKYKRVYFVERKSIFSDDDLMKMDETISKLYFQNSIKYNIITDEELENIIKSQDAELEEPSYKCKVCGLGDIEHDFAICEYCGWESDNIQNDDHEYIGGANEMSLNQYKKFWADCKDRILKHDGVKVFYAIDLAREYYNAHFKKQNEEYFRKKNPHFDEDQKRFKLNRNKNKRS